MSVPITDMIRLCDPCDVLNGGTCFLPVILHVPVDLIVKLSNVLGQFVDVEAQHFHHLPLPECHDTIEVIGKLGIGSFKVRRNKLFFPHFFKLNDSDLPAGLDYVKDITGTLPLMSATMPESLIFAPSSIFWRRLSSVVLPPTRLLR